MASIVVTGDVLRRPRGANLATHLHYLIGLRKLGHQVIYLEDRGAGEPGESPVPRAGLMLLRDLLRRCRVDVPVVWVDPDAGLVGGMVWPQLRRRLGNADLLLDLGGHSWLEERSLPRRRVLIDVDTATGALATAHRQLDHDLYFSYRREPAALGDADWLPTIPPVVPRLWYGPPSRAELPLRVWADAAGAPPGPGDGRACGLSPEQLLALPGRISARPWMALPAAHAQLGAELRRAGWMIREPDEADGSLSSHRGAMLGSQALLSARAGADAAQGVWFTGPDACHLAAGRPVIAVDPDLDSWLPTGAGLIAVSDLEGAAAAVERIQGDLPRHAAAARAIAERVFHFRVVLPSMLEQALPRRLQAAA
jgi:hypothetical protein